MKMLWPGAHRNLNLYFPCIYWISVHGNFIELSQMKKIDYILLIY